MKQTEADGKALDRSLPTVVIYGIAPIVALAIRFDVAILFGLISGVVVFLTAVFLFILRDLVKGSWLLAYTMVGAGLLVTVAEVLLGLFAPGIKQLMGLFLPVLAVSPLVLAQVDGDLDLSLGERLGHAAAVSLRFLLLMAVTAGFRELLADGSLTIIAELPARLKLIVPVFSGFSVGFFASTAGGLMLTGFLLALRAWLKARKPPKAGELPKGDEA